MVSLVRQEFCDNLGLSYTHDEQQLSFLDNSSWTTKGSLKLHFTLNATDFDFDVLVVSSLPTNLLLSFDFCQSSGLTIDFTDNSFHIKPQQANYPVISFPLQLQTKDQETDLHVTPPHWETEAFEQSESHIDILDNHSREIQSAIQCDFPDVLAEHPGLPLKHPGLMAILYHIDTGDARPIKESPYNIRGPKLESLNKQFDLLLKDGIIQPSFSPWGCPVVMVLKPDITYRMCIDFQKRNRVTNRMRTQFF